MRTCRRAIRVRPTIELSKCYVLPGHHGEGVAGRLMAASIDAAAAGRGRGDLARRQRGERARPALLRQARLRAGRFEALPGRRPARRRLGDGARSDLRDAPAAGRGQPSATLSTILPRVWPALDRRGARRRSASRAKIRSTCTRRRPTRAAARSTASVLPVGSDLEVGPAHAGRRGLLREGGPAAGRRVHDQSAAGAARSASACRCRRARCRSGR